ncbi:MAG: nucleotide exchange factor GrpE [Actinomycetia bacterium]|nr:nucleotide exchange factor GrpE [Actinomycetes bacterium]
MTSDDKHKHATSRGKAEAGTDVPAPAAPGAPADAAPDVPTSDVPTPDAETPRITDADLDELIASVNAAAAAKAGDAGASVPLTDEQRIAQLEALVAERTDDLQRLQAEYVNYKRRVDRDRAQARAQGAEAAVRELMPVLDAVAHAQEAEGGELPEGLRLVAAELTRVTGKLGLASFGGVGEDFDPNRHEALYQVPTPDAEPMSVVQVIQPGYTLNDQVIRPARVAVAAPEA